MSKQRQHAQKDWLYLNLVYYETDVHNLDKRQIVIWGPLTGQSVTLLSTAEVSPRLPSAYNLDQFGRKTGQPAKKN